MTAGVTQQRQLPSWHQGTTVSERGILRRLADASGVPACAGSGCRRVVRRKLQGFPATCEGGEFHGQRCNEEDPDGNSGQEPTGQVLMPVHRQRPSRASETPDDRGSARRFAQCNVSLWHNADPATSPKNVRSLGVKLTYHLRAGTTAFDPKPTSWTCHSITSSARA
jgi:hypothetical protein